MTRKSICPVCNKTFEVFLRNQVCCCKEHQIEWRKMQRAARDQRRIKPDDLDWANARLEIALGQIVGLMTLLAIRNEPVEAERTEKEEEQKPAPVEEKPQNFVKNAQKTQIKGKGKFLKECENCLQDFRTTDNRDRFCCDACKQEYAREMGV